MPFQELVNLAETQILFSKNEVSFQIKQAYLNYLQTFEAQNILENNRKFLDELLLFNKKLVQYNKATNDILFDVEYQLEAIKSQQFSLTQQQIIAKNWLNILLNRSLDTEIMVDQRLLEQIQIAEHSQAQSWNIAQKNRPEYEQILQSKGVNDLRKTMIQRSNTPTVGITGGIGLQTEKFDFDMGGPLYTLALGMKWNILDGGVRKKHMESIEVDQALLDNQKEQLDQSIRLDIARSLSILQSIAAQMTSQKVAISSAQKSLDILKVKYDNGKILLIEILQAQNKLISAELNLVILKYNYFSEQAKLEKTLSL